MNLTEKQAKDLQQVWFETFLKDKHYDLHQTALDDDLSDSYDNWLSSLSEMDVYELSKEWHEMQGRWVAEDFVMRNF